MWRVLEWVDRQRANPMARLKGEHVRERSAHYGFRAGRYLQLPGGRSVWESRSFMVLFLITFTGIKKNGKT